MNTQESSNTGNDSSAKEVLNRLLIQLDDMNGTRGVGDDCLNALVETLKSFSGPKDGQDLIDLLMELHDLFMDCRPRMPQIIHDVQNLMIELKDQEISMDRVAQLATELNESRGARIEASVLSGLTPLEGRKGLLLHTHGKTIEQFLLRAKSELPSLPNLFVASQQPDKTATLIQFLNDHNFDFSVVSEHSIAHIADQVDIALFGCLTLNSEEQVVLAPGASSLVAQLASLNVERYVLLTTYKFSFWQDLDVHAFKEIRRKTLEQQNYSKLVFSHDFLDVNLFTGIIVENQVLTPSETILLYEQERKAFQERERKIAQ